jgi:hypothetical protein
MPTEPIGALLTERLRANAALLRAMARGEAPMTPSDLAALARDLALEADGIEGAAARRAERGFQISRHSA